LRINDWVCEHFVTSLLEESQAVDPRDPVDQERIFATDLADRAAFYDRMEAAVPTRGALERARDLEAWRQDPLKLTKGIARYLQGDRGENLIVVFDNVDRRETEAQLAAFEAALWLMDQTRALIILQMRDATFEAYKNEPPLDTYRSGQIFHISPPRFVDVVKRRLELSLEEIDREAPEQVKYRTRAGVQVSYPKKRAGEFLRGIYAELFQSPTNLSRILEALAGRNVRRALDMFMAILTSGHMPEEIIASVVQGNGFRSFRSTAFFERLCDRISDSSTMIQGSSQIYYIASQGGRDVELHNTGNIVLPHREAKGEGGQRSDGFCGYATLDR